VQKALSVKSGPLVMTVLPGLGGRVLQCSFDGRGVLTGPEAHPDNWGATYWTSPQADWGWPPVATVDSDPYEVLAADVPGGVVLSSAPARIGERRFRIEKRFSPRAHDCIDTEYRIVNLGEDAFSMASWEINRVPPRGLTFFPTGTRVETPILPHGELSFEEQAGVSFYDHLVFRAGESLKAHADGSEGLLAHWVRESSLLVLKLFIDSPPERQATGEGEIEVFANLDGRYVEVEVQGPCESIPPQGTSSFFVRTCIVRVSPEQAHDRTALVNLARATAAKVR
jgi:hypothetical protein